MVYNYIFKNKKRSERNKRNGLIFFFSQKNELICKKVSEILNMCVVKSNFYRQCA